MAYGRARIRRAIRETEAPERPDLPDPGYEGREAQRANRRRMERWLSKNGNTHHRRVLRRRRLADHWTRKRFP